MDFKELESSELEERKNTIEARTAEIEARKAELGENVENRDADLDAIETEVDALKAEADSLNEELRAINEELEARIAKAAEEAEARNAVAGGNGEIKENNEEEVRKMSYSVDSVEYRNAWLKNLMGKELDAEERTAVTATAAIPTQTENKVIAMFQENKLLNKVDVTHFSQYVRIPVESSAAEASWTDTATDSEDALTYIELTPYQLIKTIEVPATVDQMGIDAFEDYVVNRLRNKLEVALQKAIIVGTGSSQPKGIATTVSTATGTFTKAAATKKDLLTIMGKLPSEFQEGACWIMPAGVFYGEVMNIADHVNFVNINDGFGIKLFGKDVVLDANCTISSVDTIFYGNPKHYHLNFGEDIAIAKDVSVGFRSNSAVYRGVCLADGKLDMASAFVKYTRATA